jgi:hypothetical protein
MLLAAAEEQLWIEFEKSKAFSHPVGTVLAKPTRPKFCWMPALVTQVSGLAAPRRRQGENRLPEARCLARGASPNVDVSEG